MASPGEARRGQAWRGPARQGLALRGTAWLGWAWRGKVYTRTGHEAENVDAPKVFNAPTYAGRGRCDRRGYPRGIWHLAATFDDVGGRLPYSGDELAAGWAWTSTGTR